MLSQSEILAFFGICFPTCDTAQFGIDLQEARCLKFSLCSQAAVYFRTLMDVQEITRGHISKRLTLQIHFGEKFNTHRSLNSIRLLPTRFGKASFRSYLCGLQFTLKMEATRTSEILEHFYQSTVRHISIDSSIQTYGHLSC